MGRIFITLASMAFLVLGSAQIATSDEPDGSQRMVLVELYTSQGCDMCPTAEKVLGALGEKNRRIVPIAFHVDYFNTPWKDVFSDPLYSQRQAAYNHLYTGPKHPEYGLYYTPMLMVDGVQTVNGRDAASAEAAIRQALATKPAARIDVDLDLASDGRSGAVDVRVASRSTRIEKTPLLVCAVLREDGVATDVPSGENAGKRLVARHPARRTKYDFVTLDGKAPAAVKLSFEIEPTWRPEKLRLAVFVQDKKTGAVHQAADFPWKSTSDASGTASKAKAALRP